MSERPRRRKVAALLRQFVGLAQSHQVQEWRYWMHILQRAAALLGPPWDQRLPNPEGVPVWGPPPEGWDERDLARLADEMSWLLFASVGIDAADWNLHSSPDRPQPLRIFPVRLYVDGIRSPYNLGSLFRTAEAMGVRGLLLSPSCPDPRHPRCQRVSMGAAERVPWERVEAPPLDEPLFGLETGGVPLDTFPFPPRGVLALGSEEWGLSPAMVEACRRSLGLVSIPLWGSKGSLNVAASAAIALWAWIRVLAQ